MTAINFPDSPAVNDEFTAAGKLWTWDGTVWNASSGIDGIIQQVSDIILDSAPGTLNTLNELAAALGDDADFSATVTASIATKAPIESPTFTGTVSGVTKAHVGLGNVDNTTDANKPVSTATQAALDLKANLAAPTFTGNVVLPGTTTIGNVSATELGYLDGVTSAIQTQLDAKASTANPTFTGTVDFDEATVVGLKQTSGTVYATSPMITATAGVWATIATFTLPSAGTYFVNYFARSQFNVNRASAVRLQIGDQVVPNSEMLVDFPSTNDAGTENGVTASRSIILTVTGATTYTLRGANVIGGSAAFLSENNGRSGVTWFKILAD